MKLTADRKIQRLFKNSLCRRLAFLCTLFLVCCLSGTGAYAWPTDSEWIPVYAPDGNGIQDPGGQPDDTGNGTNSTDIVGDPDNPAAYIFNDGIDIHFRIRVDADPSRGTALEPFGWGVLVDTDLDASDYEFMLMLDGISNPDEIYLARNIVQQNIDDPSDKPEQIEWIKQAAANSDYVVSPAPTNFTGDPDYFIDFKVPYDIFLLSLGIDESVQIRFFFGTSQSTQQLTADLVGSTLSDGTSDYTLPSGKRPTTGTIQFVADLTGNGDIAAFYPGEQLFIKVIDDDQNSLVSTRESVSITLQSPSGDQEILTLVETGRDTGVFTGVMATDQTSFSRNNGTLEAVPIEFVTASYLDASDALQNTNQTRTDTIRANPTADLEISKSASNNTPGPGETVTFTLTLANHGPSAASGIQVQDLLTSDLSYQGDDGNGTYNPTNGVWSIAALAVNDSTSLQIQAQVTAQPLATIGNTASILAAAQPDFNTANNSDSLTLAVSGADLAVTKSVAVTNPAIGGNLPKTGDEVTYTVTVTNQGSDTADNVIVRELLAAGQLTWLSDNSSGSYNPGSGDWAVGTLADGDSATLLITARVDAPGGTTVVNNASILSASVADPVPGNNSASASLFIDAADLQLTKSVSDATPDVGDVITYTLRVENLSGNTTDNVQITDILPSGLTFVSASPSTGNYISATGIWNLGATPLSPGDAETLSISARVRTGTAGQTIRNRASIDNASKVDPDTANNSSVVSVTVRYIDLAISKTASTTSPADGDPVSFTVTVTNKGSVPATGVQVYDKLPVQLYNDVSGGGSNVAVTTTFTDPTDSYSLSSWMWTIGDLAVGASATMILNATVKIPNGGSSTFFNLAQIAASDQADPFPADNAASVLLGVTGTDIEVVSKTASSLTPAAPTGGVNDIVTYTIVVRNNGPNDATNLSISEVLPAGLSYVAGSATDDYTPPVGETDLTAYAANTGIWKLGYKAGGNTIFPVGAVVTLTLQAEVTAPAGTRITNTAAVNSLSGSDTVPGNNSQSVTITVSGTDLELTKTVSAPRPTVGDAITYTLTVQNLGPYPAVDIEVTDVLPAGLTYLSHTAGSYDPATGLWDLGPGPLADGATTSLVITARVEDSAAGQSLTNTAAISSQGTPDPVPGNNTASATLEVQESELSIIKTVDNSTPDENASVTFTLTLRNNGPQEATGVQVTDFLPAGMQYESSSPDQGTVTTTSNPDGTTNVIWTLGNPPLAKNQFVSLDITIRPTAGTGGTTLTNTTSITASSNFEANPTNNVATMAITPKAAANLTIIKSANTATAQPGDTIIYTLIVTNTGKGAAAGIVVDDLMSPFADLVLDPYGTGDFYSFSDPSGRLTPQTPVFTTNADGDITAWQLPMQGSLQSNGRFTLVYQATVE